jgi:hypothetical protein
VEALSRSKGAGERCQIRASARCATATSSQKPLDGQPLATLGSASGKHQSTGAGCHASTEAVGTGAVDLAGLVSALHAQSRYAKLAKKQAHAIVGRAARVRTGQGTVKRSGIGKCPSGAPVGAVDNLAGEG